MGDDAEHGNDGGLEHRDGQHHHRQGGDQEAGPYVTAEPGPQCFGLDHVPAPIVSSSSVLSIMD